VHGAEPGVLHEVRDLGEVLRVVSGAVVGDAVDADRVLLSSRWNMMRRPEGKSQISVFRPHGGRSIFISGFAARLSAA